MSSVLAWAFVVGAILTVVGLVHVLARPGVMNAVRVWALTALVPVLLSVTAALTARSGAERQLEPPRAHALTFTWAETVQRRTQTRELTVTLASADAACLARAVRLNAEGQYRVRDIHGRMQTVQVMDTTTVRGPLPSQAHMDALALTDHLTCRPR